MVNANIKVKRSRKTKSNATEIQMLVQSNSEDTYDIFDGQAIINSLKKELDMSEEDAISIAKKVEDHLIKANFKVVSSSFIRSLLNQILTDYGYDKWIKYSSLSIPVYDVKQLIEEHNSENSNTAFSPESINLTIAGQILKQFALREIFDKDVAEAHIKGDLHIHDLDFANRIYCSGNNPEYIKKHGLKLNGIMTQSSPSRHALTLVNHLSCFTNYLQCFFSGAIGWEAVNMYFAPLLVNKSKEELKQVAQHLIYSFAQLAGARGGQTAFTDFNMYLRVPEHYKNTKAVGAGGEYTGKTYAEYENEMRAFLVAILEVLSDGDANNANFAFPKILLHITKKDKDDEIMNLVGSINSKRGSVYILYDKGDSVKISQCCRLSILLSESEINRMTEAPEEMRFSAWQNVTLILPRIAYKHRTVAQIHKEIDRLLHIVMKAHINKRDYILKLLAKGNDGCLNFLTTGMDGKPYTRPEEAKFLVGIIGLNEMVQCLTGKQLHESDDALLTGLNIMAYIYKSMNTIAAKYGLTCLLEETPAEGLSLRSALLDLKQFPQAQNYIKGNIETGNIYYTNSVHLSYEANVDILTRIEKQSKFAPMIQAGSIIHNWFGEHEPDPTALKNLYFKVLEHTNAVQTADSPDMTVCESCHSMSKGLHAECPKCKSTKVYQMTRITGYFSKTSGWTKSKLAELKDRVRVNLEMTSVDTSVNATGEVIYFFSKPDCEKCDFVKKQLLSIEHTDKINIVDTKTYDGLALACYYNINLLPAIIKVVDGHVISKLEQTGSFLKWIKENI